MTISRRHFLGGTAVALAALADAFPGLSFALGPPGERLLVVIQLAGGNDGLNTVAPVADPLYRKLRPKLALGADEVLPLEEGLALNGAMKELHGLYGQRQVAIVQGVGYPKPNRSHFEATNIWQTANLVPYREPTGWLGRAFDHVVGPRPLEAVGIGGGLTPALAARTAPVISLLSLDAFTVKSDPRFPADVPALASGIAGIYGEAREAGDLAFLRGVGRSALAASNTLGEAVRGYASEVQYPKNGFGDQLRLVAELASAGLGLRVAHLTLGGFDTHSNQKRQQANLLGQLSDGIAALLEDAGRHGFADRLAVMTYSEFGRRAAENGSGGTDHGAASVGFLVGEKVRGGLYGAKPDLSRLEQGDLTHAVDFRSVYAGVLRDWVGVRPEPVLGHDAHPLPLFRA